MTDQRTNPPKHLLGYEKLAARLGLRGFLVLIVVCICVARIIAGLINGN